MKPNRLPSKRLAFVAGLALMLALFGPAPLGVVTSLAEAGPSAYVTTGRLNVRVGPGTSFAVITRIDQWQTMALLARNAAASWVDMRLPSGVEGWVNAHYIHASVPVAQLPVVNTNTIQPATATVSVPQLELRAGPSFESAVLAVLNQGQAMQLLGRTANAAWVKVSTAEKGEGWVVARVTVRVAGAENGLATQPFSAPIDLNSLPVVSEQTSSQPRVSLSNTRVGDNSPIYITVEGFPVNRPVAAVLTSRLVPIGMVVASGQTDALGSARLFFRMPDTWSSGATMTENALSLAVGTTDGAVLVWNGIWCD